MVEMKKMKGKDLKEKVKAVMMMETKSNRNTLRRNSQQDLMFLLLVTFPKAKLNH